MMMKTKTLMNSKEQKISMENGKNLDTQILSEDEYWNRVNAGLERFIQRYMPNGKFERFGPTAQCLTIPEFDDYADNRISERRKQRYDTHIESCEDCAEVFEKLQDYLINKRSQSKMAIWYREAIALPYRINDYFSERRAEMQQHLKT